MRTKDCLVVAVLACQFCSASGQSVWLSNYGLSVDVRTQYPNALANGPITVSLWYLPGATSVPANLSAFTYDQQWNVTSGGVISMLNDGYQQVSSLTLLTADNGKFDADFVTVPVPPGSSPVLAVVGWTGSETDINFAWQSEQIGVVSFIDPVGTFNNPSGLLTGWQDSGMDLVLQYYPIPEPSVMGLVGTGATYLLLRARNRRGPRSGNESL
jgi:hypothetical protein